MNFVTSTAEAQRYPNLRGPGGAYRNDLPITTLAADRITFPVDATVAKIDHPKVAIPEWQRWNDYGIGLLLEGQGGARGELRQAAEAFTKVEELGRFDGPLNLARVYNLEGRINEATDAIARASQFNDPPAPPWTIAWLSGLLNRQQGYLEAAEKNFRSVLEDRTPEMEKRRFDFSKDYEVINELGGILFERAKQLLGPERRDARVALEKQAIDQFRKTLLLDSENTAAHYNLSLLFQQIGDKENAEKHRTLHARYKLDDNWRDRAIILARQKYPAANHAAEALVIYSLNRPDAPGLVGNHACGS